MNDNDYNVFSINDVLRAYRDFENDNANEDCTNALYFVSELTGLSVDRIGELIDELED